MRFELPINDGKVIELSVIRESRGMRAYSKRCPHHKITIDSSLANIHCNDCDQDLNPVEWIAMLAEHWHHYVDSAKRLQEARAFYDAKTRCKCDHCGKMTRVRPATAAQVREFNRARGETD